MKRICYSLNRFVYIPFRSYLLSCAWLVRSRISTPWTPQHQKMCNYVNRKGGNNIELSLQLVVFHLLYLPRGWLQTLTFPLWLCTYIYELDRLVSYFTLFGCAVHSPLLDLWKECSYFCSLKWLVAFSLQLSLALVSYWNIFIVLYCWFSMSHLFFGG